MAATKTGPFYRNYPYHYPHMCGIAGIWSKKQAINASVLAPALTRMRHRGPAGNGNAPDQNPEMSC